MSATVIKSHSRYLILCYVGNKLQYCAFTTSSSTATTVLVVEAVVADLFLLQSTMNTE